MTIEQLDAAALLAVRNGQIAVLRVPRFCSPVVADRLADVLLADPRRVNYQTRWTRSDAAGHLDGDGFTLTDVDRVGPPDTAPGIIVTDAEVVAAMRTLRAAAAPDLGPIDRLRLELDEVMVGGAGLTRVGGRLRLAGIGRVMEASAEFVHADVTRQDCLTANVYLRMPRHGGGTTVWSYDGHYREAIFSYRFAPGEVPDNAPRCTFVPEQGDLAIWNPTLPHMVHAFEDGPRVSVQVWLQFRHLAAEDGFAVGLVN